MLRSKSPPLKIKQQQQSMYCQNMQQTQQQDMISFLNSTQTVTPSTSQQQPNF